MRRIEGEFRAEQGEPPRTLQTVDRLAFAAFRAPTTTSPSMIAATYAGTAD